VMFMSYVGSLDRMVHVLYWYLIMSITMFGFLIASTSDDAAIGDMVVVVCVCGRHGCMYNAAQCTMSDDVHGRSTEHQSHDVSSTTRWIADSEQSRMRRPLLSVAMKTEKEEVR
jgi:hypothetical protein